MANRRSAMNAESPDKDYLDYIRDARALRAKYLSELMSNGWRRMKGLIRSYRHRLGDIHRLTRNWQE
jgi:hypothetical protein